MVVTTPATQSSNPMIFRWFAPASREASIASLYGAIVAQARRPAFYQIYRVPDTVTGRLEMIMLHAVLVLHRLQGESAAGRELGQDLFDRFCSDMDDNLREMGVGDLTVPKRMQAFGEAFYGRVAAYDLALSDDQEEPLAQAICKNILDGEGIDNARRLAAYARTTVARLDHLDDAALLAASWAFPSPLEERHSQ